MGYRTPDASPATGRTMAGRLEVQPDIDGARRWVGSVRRVSLVEIVHQPAGRPACRVRGHGPRLPFSRAIPLSLALGLEAIGVPLRIRWSEDPAEREGAR